MDVHARNRKLKRAAFVAIIVSGLITVVAYGFPRISLWHGSHSEPGTLVVSLGVVPGAAPLYSVDKDTSSVTLLTIPVNGKNHSVIDMVKASDGSTYYLVAESTKPVSNLYKKGADGTITALTHSDTMKYNLSYDAGSQKLAYQELMFTNAQDFVDDNHWDLVLYDLQKGTGSTVGKGMNPVLVPGGNGMLYEDGSVLAFEDLNTLATTSVLQLPKNQPYAISPDVKKVAVYNLTTHAIDEYALADGVSPSYVRSFPAKIRPLALAYVNGTLLGGYVAQKDGAIKYTFSDPSIGNLNGIAVDGVKGAAPQRLYAYEP